ncbi:trichome birefringence 13 [Spatholobus suberectus]|nr:trichome birefringence 13 [Spatholobus suberectus]
MATREGNPPSAKKRVPLFPLLSLLCFTSIFLLLSQFKTTSTPSTPYSLRTFQIDDRRRASCDYSDGTWIHDPARTPRYDNTCKEVFKGWNCLSANKSNAPQLATWRWRPRHCDLPQFDPAKFLRTHAHTGIVQGLLGIRSTGTCLSLFSALLRVSPTDTSRSGDPPVLTVDSPFSLTISPSHITVPIFSLVMLLHESMDCTVFVCCKWSASDHGGALETLGFREGFRVDVDIPESTWVRALSFHDILIFNTGHWWWAPSKFDPVKSPMLFFKNGQPVIPPLRPDQGLDMVLGHMIPYVEEKARPGAVKFFRTQSPRHFEGGDWDQGGSCQRDRPLSVEQVEELFSVKNNGTNVEARLVNDRLYKALKGSGFIVLDITHLSEFRADAHPASAGGKKHDDCMHWCLPGITDTWNDLFIELLNSNRGRS